MKRLLGCLAPLVALVACAPTLQAQPPHPFGVPLAITADTVRITADPCNVDEPAIACAVALNGTVGSSAITFAALPNVVRGGSITTSATFSCSTPGQSVTVTVNVVSRALNRSGQASPPQTGTGTTTYTCADAPPGQPRPFTVTIIVGTGGS